MVELRVDDGDGDGDEDEELYLNVYVCMRYETQKVGRSDGRYSTCLNIVFSHIHHNTIYTSRISLFSRSNVASSLDNIVTNCHNCLATAHGFPWNN